MNKKLKCFNIVQTPQVGAVILTELDAKGNQIPGAVRVALQFKTAAEAAKFEQGKEYNISITPTK